MADKIWKFLCQLQNTLSRTKRQLNKHKHHLYLIMYGIKKSLKKTLHRNSGAIGRMMLFCPCLPNKETVSWQFKSLWECYCLTMVNGKRKHHFHSKSVLLFVCMSVLVQFPFNNVPFTMKDLRGIFGRLSYNSVLFSDISRCISASLV